MVPELVEGVLEMTDMQEALQKCRALLFNSDNHYPKFGKHLPKDAYNRKCVKNKAATAGLFSFYMKSSQGARLASPLPKKMLPQRTVLCSAEKARRKLRLLCMNRKVLG